MEESRIDKRAENIDMKKSLRAEKNSDEENPMKDSERDRVRKSVKKRKILSGIFVVVLVGMIVVLSVIGVKNLVEIAKKDNAVKDYKENYMIKAEIIDENGGKQFSSRVKDYVGLIERDLSDLGFVLAKVILPQGKARELDLYLEGRTIYFKVNIDRGAAESAEDMIRTLKYIEGNGVGVNNYVDVRVEGKAFYK